MTQSIDRMPPQAVDVEQAVLGAMLMSQDAIVKAVQLLDAQAFYHAPHATIFKTALLLFDRNIAVDQLTLAEELRRQQSLDQVGGVVYLSKLAMSVATAANIDHHAAIVRDKATARHLIRMADEISRRAYEGAETAVDQLDLAEQQLYGLTKSHLVATKERPSTTDALMPIVRQRYEEAEELTRSGRMFAGLDSGIDAVNDAINGILPAELTVIGARNSVGKTTLALQMALSVAEQTGVGFSSTEMTSEQMAGRLAALEAAVDPYYQRRGRLGETERQRFYAATHSLEGQPLRIFEGETTVAQIRARILRTQREQKVGLWIIDHLHRMKGPGDGKYEMYSRISSQLADLAIEMHLPIILLAQLNRKCEDRPDKRPEAQDLRDCGSIEEDAVNIGLLWRPGRYVDLRDKCLKKLRAAHMTADQIDQGMYDFDSTAQILWEKARFEGTSVKDIGWEPNKGHFVNLKANESTGGM